MKYFLTCKELLANMVKCPLEILIMFQTVVGIFFEEDDVGESERSFLIAFLHYLQLYGDP